MTRLKLGSWVQGTLHQNYDNAPNVTSIPGKITGICTPLSSLGWPGSKVKGLSHLYTNNDAVSAGEKAWTFLGNELTKTTSCGGRTAPTADDAYNSGYALGTKYTADSVLTDEFTDGKSDSICDELYWQTAYHFNRGLLARFGNPSPANNNLFGGYMADQNDLLPRNFKVSFGGYNSVPLHPFYLDGIKSQANARKRLNRNNQTYQYDFEFFSWGMHNLINLMTGCYVGLNEPDESQMLFGSVAEMERKKLAGISKTIAYLSSWSQSVTLPTDTVQKNSGVKIYRPDVGEGDYWKVKDWPITPLYALDFFSFYALLAHEGWMFFDSYRWNSTKNPADMANEPFFFNENLIEWKSPGGRPAPALPPATNANQYPFRPMLGIDLAIDNIRKCNTVRPILQASDGLKYFTYTENGATVPHRNGTLGAYTVTSSKLNYNQDTIYRLADAKKGMCIGAEIGNDFFAAYFNPYMSPRQKKNIVVTLPSGRTVDMGALSGKRWHIEHS